MKSLFCFLLIVFLTSDSYATDRFYDDIHTKSPSGRYHVDATSPDNKKPGYNPFQDEFTYRCTDSATGNVIWTRKQPMSATRPGKEESPEEGSPVSITVSNKGTTIIYTGWDNLIVVSPTGKVIHKLDFLEDALTKDENNRYVQHTTAGPQWASLSLWCFVDQPDSEYFVVRPWWGRRVFIDVSNGKTEPANKQLTAAAIESESELVMESLKSKSETEDQEFEKIGALYLAGVLNLESAIPFLKTAEESTIIGLSTAGGWPHGKEHNDQVNPHSYRAYSLRQVAQLSLRRLGVAPRALPCHAFELIKDGELTPFAPKLARGKRHEHADKIKVGMSAKEVLNLIGSPDFILHDRKWSYDMDAEKPFTLTLKLDAWNVTRIKREDPVWKTGLLRDKALAN